MENGDEKITDYSFLLDSHVEENFAELNWSLLSGRHISPEDSLHFGILEDHQEFIAYYKNLYQLSLERIEFDGVPCYYLGFFDSGKGKLNERSRIKPLSEIQTVIGLIFLDMYYARYFDHPKLVNWQQIKHLIEESDHRNQYQRVLFKTKSQTYSENQWENVRSKFKRTITSFELLGWVNIIDGQALLFEIKPSIHRLATLYKAELENFEVFSQNLQNQTES